LEELICELKAEEANLRRIRQRLEERRRLEVWMEMKVNEVKVNEDDEGNK
jgi:hypothetical protein